MIDKKNFYILFFLSILFFLTKWFYSYLINFDLDIFTRILFNVDDRHYLPLVYSFSKFDLNPVYNNYDESFLLLPFPIYSIGIHSILFKIFGISSFLITEWLFIFGRSHAGQGKRRVQDGFESHPRGAGPHR